MDENPTAENIARLIYDFAQGRGYPVVRVDLWETPQLLRQLTKAQKKSPAGPR